MSQPWLSLQLVLTPADRRLYTIAKLKKLKVLDFRKVKQKVRRLLSIFGGRHRLERWGRWWGLTA